MAEKKPQQNQEAKAKVAKNRAKPENKPRKLTIQEVENHWRQVFSINSAFNIGGLKGFNIGAAFGNNPYISNSRIKNLSTNPALPVRDVLEKALGDPENNEFILRQATHSIINQTYPLYRLQYLYEGILSFNHYYYPKYVDKSDVEKPRFKTDEKLVDMWVKELRPKKTFRRIVAEVMAEGKKSYLLRQEYCAEKDKEEVKYVMLQNLPSEYYKITRITNDSYYGISFNFMYFTTPGASVDQFPDYFKTIAERLMNSRYYENGKLMLNPNEGDDEVTIEYDSATGTWAYWAEIPAEYVWTFCFTEADPMQASPFISLLLLGSDLTNYNLLQQQLVSAPLNSLILGEMIVNDDTKNTGFQPDNFFISPEAVSLFEGKINSALGNSNISYQMTPSVKNQMFNIPNIPNSNTIYNEAVKQFINTSMSGALQSLSERPTVAQSNNARITEFKFIDRIYQQFEHFVCTMFDEMYDLGDLHYRWEFKLFGNSFLEKEETQQLESSLSLGQSYLLPKYLACRDLSLLDAKSLTAWVDNSELYDKFKPLVSSFNASANPAQAKGGRPKEENPDNENTAASQDSGLNSTEAKGNISKTFSCPNCGEDIEEGDTDEI